jgi:hypothetical protein
MINMVEPRGAADADSVTSSDSLQDGELTSLIRRWMAAGSKVQDRVRRDSILRIAPDPESIEQHTAELDAPEPEVEAVEVEAVEGEDLAAGTMAAESPRDDGPSPDPVLAGFPPLPRRSTGGEAEKVHRVAVLIDARRVSADVATGLLQRLAERGSVNVCRAYADWNSVELGDWVQQLRREGLHSFHHFAEDDDQALVAMTIDAVDIARDAAVDEVVIAGDLTSALPLVHRLHAAGVRVVAVGSAHTPHDVRAACHEFIDTSTIDGTYVAPVGRHRA